MIRVLLVDDHEVVRRGVAGIINSEPDMEVVGEASTVRQGSGRIAATRPDVAVLDVRLPDGSGIDLCRSVRSAFPEMACLMLTAHDDDGAGEAAVLAGASGYVLKDIRGQKLIDAIREVAAGRTLIHEAVARRILVRLQSRPAATPADALSVREREVLELIADGMTNRQIGEVLGLAEKTVKNYVSGVLRKLNMERRTQAAVFGSELRGG